MTSSTAKAAIVHAVRRRIGAGDAEQAACAAEGVHRCTYRRWSERLDAGGVTALADGASSGRPPIVALTPAESAELRALYIRSNRSRGKGSVSAAARLAARDASTCLRPETRAAILAPRASKHQLPVEIRRACRVAPATIRHYRDPDAINLGGIHAKGLMRMTRDAAGALRRLRAGERQNWDDGSVNFGVCVPWPRGGDACSAKYGVRVARFQLLAGTDDAWDFCPGWNYVMRMQDSYRAEDVCATLHGVWGQTYVPECVVLEGGAWQSRRTLEFVGAAGARVISAKGRPRGKLIEGWWNRLWTVLSMRTGGQIGRYRDEMKRENDLWMEARAGRTDPRRHFPMLDVALTAIEWSVDFLNHDPIESAEYGRWVPAEAHAAEIAAQPPRRLPEGLGFFAARERALRTVRRDGVVGATALSPLGSPYGYIFQQDSLMAFEGAAVWAYFDPWANPVAAVCVLAEPWKGAAAGKVVATGAACLNAAPELLRAGNIWQVAWGDAALQARLSRTRAHAYVRHEQRALSADGAQVVRVSRDNTGAAAGLAIAGPTPLPPEADPLETATDFDALEAAAGVVASRAS